ncbi:MAG: LptF/LptG family permease [bacterium]|nr:LptF/LptG family permease [bacterium]
MATRSLHAVQVRPPTGRPIFTILDRYLLAECIGPFAFALGAFLLFEFINFFFLAADYIINAHAPFGLVLRFLVFRVPLVIPMAAPFACLFATMMAFGRLAADNEITALRTSGVSFMRISAPLLLSGIVIFISTYLINEHITPVTVDLSTRSFYQIVYRTATLPVEPQFFRKDPDSGRTFYVDRVEPDGKTMDGVMIFEPGKSNFFQKVTTAQKAYIDNEQLVLRNARQVAFRPDGTVAYTVTGKDITVPLPLQETASKFLSTTNTDPYTMSSKQLGAQVNAMKAQGLGGPSVGILEITLAQKLAYPFGSFIAVLIAIPLAARFGKKGRTLGVTLSIVVLFVYQLFMAAMAALGRNGEVNAFLAAWTPNVVTGLAGGLLLYLEDR